MTAVDEDRAVDMIAAAIAGEEARICGPGYGACGTVYVGAQQARELARIAARIALQAVDQAGACPTDATLRRGQIALQRRIRDAVTALLAEQPDDEARQQALTILQGES